jgi:hypothetical protein
MQKRSSNDVNQIAAAALAQVTQAALRQALTNAAASGPAQDETPMPKRSSSEAIHNDANQTAASVPAEGTQDAPAKNPAAVALGRKGGLKGGKARAESLSAAERARIAKKAAKARWKRR